jgi:hypothetical protein
MSKPVLGLLCGLLFGAISVATMIPLSFDDKRAAIEFISIKSLATKG